MRKVSLFLIALFVLLLFVDDAEAGIFFRRRVKVVNNTTVINNAPPQVNFVPAPQVQFNFSSGFSPRPVFVGFDAFGRPIFR